MQSEHLANLLKVISTKRRLDILRALIDYPKPVSSSTLAALVGIGEGPASFNLRKLAEVGLLLTQPSGRWVFYTPNRTLIQEIQSFFQTQETSKETHNE